MGALVQRGLIAPAILARHLGPMIKDANASARGLPVRAFPAIAAAALARDQVRGRRPSELLRRLRLLWASLTGVV